MAADILCRSTTSDDQERVLAFYTEMIDAMRGTDFDILWKHDVHPSHSFLRENTVSGNTVIGETLEGDIACSLVVDHEPASGYEKVPWAVSGSRDEIGIVHAVATLPHYHGRGYARELVNQTIALFRERGMRALRLDTFVTNVRAQGLYSSIGFVDHGVWPLYYDDLGTVELKMYEYVL